MTAEFRELREAVKGTVGLGLRNFCWISVGLGWIAYQVERLVFGPFWL